MWVATQNTRYKLPHSVAIEDALKLVRDTPATFIAFQELFSRERARLLDRALDDINWDFYYVKPIGIAWRRKTWTVRRRGAFRQHGKLWRGNRGAGGEWQGSRHVVWARLEDGERRRTAAGIYHVPSPNASRARDKISEIEVKRAVRWMRSAQMPVVLGDWNVPWDHPNMDPVYSAGFTTSFADLRNNRPTHGTKQIDYGAYSPDDYYCKVNEVLDGYRSDHRPVLLDVYPKRVS